MLKETNAKDADASLFRLFACSSRSIIPDCMVKTKQRQFYWGTSRRYLPKTGEAYLSNPKKIKAIFFEQKIFGSTSPDI